MMLIKNHFSNNPNGRPGEGGRELRLNALLDDGGDNERNNLGNRNKKLLPLLE